MGIKSTPTNFRTYEKAFKNRITSKIKQLKEKYNNIKLSENKHYDEIKRNIKCYKEHFNINLDDFDEFNSNCYIDGTFTKMTKRVFIKHENQVNDYKYDLILLIKLGKKLEQLHEIEDKLNILYKCEKIKIKEYNDYLRKYFNVVHKHMILDGEGYIIAPTLGYICFNRCKLVNPKPCLDYNKTRIKKEELNKQGVRLWNKDEETFCLSAGIDYDGVDYRVYRDKKYVYELAWIGATCKNATKLKFISSDYRHHSIRGKSNNDLIEECHNNPNEIINLDVDIKTKLNICIDINKILYNKFIRNENQQPIATSKNYRKGGQ
jgi:hypothetical protein